MQRLLKNLYMYNWNPGPPIYNAHCFAASHGLIWNDKNTVSIPQHLFPSTLQLMSLLSPLWPPRPACPWSSLKTWHALRTLGTWCFNKRLQMSLFYSILKLPESFPCQMKPLLHFPRTKNHSCAQVEASS